MNKAILPTCVVLALVATSTTAGAATLSAEAPCSLALGQVLESLGPSGGAVSAVQARQALSQLSAGCADPAATPAGSSSAGIGGPSIYIGIGRDTPDVGVPSDAVCAGVTSTLTQWTSVLEIGASVYTIAPQAAQADIAYTFEEGTTPGQGAILTGQYVITSEADAIHADWARGRPGANAWTAQWTFLGLPVVLDPYGVSDIYGCDGPSDILGVYHDLEFRGSVYGLTNLVHVTSGGVTCGPVPC